MHLQLVVVAIDQARLHHDRTIVARWIVSGWWQSFILPSFSLQRRNHRVPHGQWSKFFPLSVHACIGGFCMLHMQNTLQHHKMPSCKFDCQSLVWQCSLHCAKRCHATGSSHQHQGPMARRSRRSVELGPWCCHSRPGPDLQNQQRCWRWHGPVASRPAAFCKHARDACSQCDAPIWLLPCSCWNITLMGPMHDQYFEECGELNPISFGPSPPCRRVPTHCLVAATPLQVWPIAEEPQLRHECGGLSVLQCAFAASVQNPPCVPLHLSWWLRICCWVFSWGTQGMPGAYVHLLQVERLPNDHLFYIAMLHHGSVRKRFSASAAVLSAQHSPLTCSSTPVPTWCIWSSAALHFSSSAESIFRNSLLICSSSAALLCNTLAFSAVLVGATDGKGPGKRGAGSAGVDAGRLGEMASIWPMMLRATVSMVFRVSWIETVVLFSESDGILPSARVRLRFAGGCEDDDGTVTRGTPVPPWLCATVGDSNVFRTLWTEPLGVCILEETGEVPPVFKIDFNKGFSKGNSSLVSFIADSFFWSLWSHSRLLSSLLLYVLFFAFTFSESLESLSLNLRKRKRRKLRMPCFHASAHQDWDPSKLCCYATIQSQICCSPG